MIEPHWAAVFAAVGDLLALVRNVSGVLFIVSVMVADTFGWLRLPRPLQVMLWIYALVGVAVTLCRWLGGVP